MKLVPIETPEQGPPQLLGEGFPEGKVTAPVGAIYTDTLATAGAIRWIKTRGTGTTGWEVEWGDTGWRDVTSTYTEAFDPTNTGTIRLRRQGNDVRLSFSSVTLEQGSATLTIGTLPVGWENSVRKATSNVTRRNSTSRAQIIVVDTSRIWWLAESYVTSGETTTTRPDQDISGTVEYVTDAPWPSTLPGSPS